MSDPAKQRRPREQAREDLDALLALLPNLDDDVPALRHRSRSRGVLTDAELQRQVDDWRERKANAVWLEQRGLTPSGPSTIPVDLMARQLRAQITTELDLLEYDVAMALGAEYEQSSTDVARIWRLRRLLRRLHVKAGLEASTAERVAGILTLARNAIDPAPLGQLGECPWCGGDTLEVDYAAETITCTNRGCRCSTVDCASCAPPPGKHRSPHVWRRGEWEALAKMCRAIDQARENRRMREDLIEWLRRQFAADETVLRARMFNARVGHADPADAAELDRIEQQRRALDDMDDAQLRELAARFTDRAGYRQEWAS